MFDFDINGPCYYIRLEKRTEYLNLLFAPRADVAVSDVNKSMQHLFRQYADASGTITYFDSEELCLVSTRSRDYTGLRVYLYDEQAPYQGLYMDGMFIEALETT